MTEYKNVGLKQFPNHEDKNEHRRELYLFGMSQLELSKPVILIPSIGKIITRVLPEESSDPHDRLWKPGKAWNYLCNITTSESGPNSNWPEIDNEIIFRELSNQSPIYFIPMNKLYYSYWKDSDICNYNLFIRHEGEFYYLNPYDTSEKVSLITSLVAHSPIYNLETNKVFNEETIDSWENEYEWATDISDYMVDQSFKPDKSIHHTSSMNMNPSHLNTPPISGTPPMDTKSPRVVTPNAPKKVHFNRSPTISDSDSEDESVIKRLFDNESKRIDETNGKMYTKKEFFDYYQTNKVWEYSKPEQVYIRTIIYDITDWAVDNNVSYEKYSLLLNTILDTYDD